MRDPVFGLLKEEEGYGWTGQLVLEFGGVPRQVELTIPKSGEEGSITPCQRESFEAFWNQWPQLQPKVLDALIRYYNEEERFVWGPDDPEEFARWWPEIETHEAMYQQITLTGLVIPRDFVMKRVKEGRCVYLLFERAWGGEDLDQNGVGVCCKNEEVDEVGYQTIAF